MESLHSATGRRRLPSQVEHGGVGEWFEEMMSTINKSIPWKTKF